MLRSIETLLEALHANDILYCNLKGNDQHLKHALTGESDMDVLFDIKQKEKLKLILTMLGFKELVAIRQKRYKDVYDFFTLDTASGKVIHLHTYFRITIGEPFLKGYQPDIVERVLATRVYNQAYGLYCIQPALELTLLYITEALRLRLRDRIQLFLKNNLPPGNKAIYEHNWLRAHTTPADIEDTINPLFAKHTEIISLFASEFNRETLQRIAPHVRKALAKDRLYSPTHGLWLRWSREASLKIRRKLSHVFGLPILSRRINPRGGTVVCIMEDNDAMRATICNSLKATFGKIDVYHVRLQTLQTENRSKAAFDEKNSITRALRAVLSALKTWQKAKRIELAKKKGALVICDLNPFIHNGSFEPGSPLLSDLPTSRNLILKYLAGLETRIYNLTINSYLPDLVFQFSHAEDVVKCPTLKESCFYESAILRADKKTSAISVKPRCVKADPGKTLDEKLRILRHEIWKEF